MINIKSPVSDSNEMTLQQQKESALAQWVNQSTNIVAINNSTIMGFEDGGGTVDSSPERTVNKTMEANMHSRPLTGGGRRRVGRQSQLQRD